MDGEDKRTLNILERARAVYLNCKRVDFRSEDDDVSGLLRRAAEYLDDGHDGHAEAVALSYDNTGVTLNVYIHCENFGGAQTETVDV